MRLGLLLFSAGMAAVATSVHASQFTIASGDVHAQATVTGTPPTKDTPADVTLGPTMTSGNVPAQATVAGPDGATGSFTSSAGVSLNSASFSFTGHSTGDGGVAGKPIGVGSGSIDLSFTLDSPTNVHFQGTLGSPFTAVFTSSGSLSMNGNQIVPLTFDINGSMDFTQQLAAGSYDLQATGTIGTSGSFGGNGSENVTATIVPEPVTAMAGLGALGIFSLMRKR